MYFRNTKTRKVQSQSTLRAATKRSSTKAGSVDVYQHTYGVSLPPASYDVMLPCIRGITGGMSAPNMSMRSLHTLGVWSNHLGHVCRCAFIQPELASATCNIPASKLQAAELAKKNVVYEIPSAEECRIGPPAGRPNGTPQISGRMAPYVVSEAGLENVAVWGFANICKTRLLFMVSTQSTNYTLCHTRFSIMLLKNYMPEYAACIYDDNMSCYRITVSPDSDTNSAEPNKNTSLIMYGDGTLKLQGKPSGMERVSAALFESIHSISASKSWGRFLASMLEVEVLEEDKSYKLLIDEDADLS
jgi:hypothetical protein